MTFSVADITESVAFKPPRIIITGTQKVGKSTFGADSDRPVFIPVKGEEGIDDLKVKAFPVSQTFADVMSSIYSLYTDPHNYGTVIVDSGSTLEPLIWEAVCAKHNSDSIEKVLNGYGKGYTEALYMWRQFTDGLDLLRTHRNMAIIIIGHVKVKRFDDPNGDSYDRYQFDINDRAANALFRWADCILFSNKKTVVKTEKGGFNDTKKALDVTGGKSYLYTQNRPAHPGGGRGVYGRLPYEMELGWDYFMQAVGTAIQQQQTATL